MIGNRHVALHGLAEESELYLRLLSFARLDLENVEEMALLMEAIDAAEIAVGAVESIAAAMLKKGLGGMTWHGA